MWPWPLTCSMQQSIQTLEFLMVTLYAKFERSRYIYYEVILQTYKIVPFDLWPWPWPICTICRSGNMHFFVAWGILKIFDYVVCFPHQSPTGLNFWPSAPGLLAWREALATGGACPLCSFFTDIYRVLIPNSSMNFAWFINVYRNINFAWLDSCQNLNSDINCQPICYVSGVFWFTRWEWGSEKATWMAEQEHEN